MNAQALRLPGLRGALARCWQVAFALTFTIGLGGLAAPVAAAVVEGEASYRERIMPPADAVLVVTVFDTARADAPAIELASARQRLAGGPPYRWALMLDERLVAASSGAVVRARIEAGGALWMTTDTATPAFGSAPLVLVLRIAQAAPVTSPTAATGMPSVCASATTQAALNTCAYDEFLDASAVHSARLREAEARLSPAQRGPWRKAQKAWLGYRTEACQFESAGAGIGSARPMVQWLCTARMTRVRSEELTRSLECREGDLSCAFPRKTGGGS